jgi:hypothetical protein
MSTSFRTTGVSLLIAALATAFFPASASAGKGGGGGHPGGGNSSGFSGGHSAGWSGSGFGGNHAGNSGWSHGSSPGGHTGDSHNFAPSSAGHGPSGAGHSENWNHGSADHHADWHGSSHGDWHGSSHGDWHGSSHGDWHGDWHGGWDSGRAWWHDHGHNWVGWWNVGFGSPWLGFGWWPGYYGFYYGAPYCGGLYADYSYDSVPYTAAYTPAETASVATAPAGGDGSDFYAQALAAFQQGEYRNATRLAGHASIDDPRNPDVHVLLMLGLFAIGEYRGSAMEAHAVASLGKTPDWAKLCAIYGNVDPYTEHLRALEKSAREKPTAAEGRFLLGYQYVMEGHPEAAQNEFLQALKLTPKDRLAAQLLKEVGGKVPDDIAKQLTPPPPVPGTFDNAGKGK